MSFRFDSWRAAAVLLALAPAWAARAEAQSGASGGVEVGYADSYVWRGMTLAEPFVVTPAAFVRLRSGANVLSAGVWTAWEPRSAPAGATSLRGPAGAGLSEWDVWGQYTRRLAGADVGLGVVHYAFPERGGLGATEAYLQLWPSSTRLPVELKGALYVELAGETAAYAELEAHRSISILPIPTAPVSLLLDATAGFSLRAPAENAAAGRGFADEGPTHLGLSAMLGIALGPLGLHGGVRHQRSFDEAARRVAPGRESSHRTWGEAGLSYTFGARRE